MESITIDKIVRFQYRKPKIVCLCGSTRFMEAFQAANLQETLEGNIVLSVGCNTKSDADLFRGMGESEMRTLKAKLDELHKRKIDLADEVLILNVGQYVGDSTQDEIDYARRLGKVLRYLEPVVERQKESVNISQAAKQDPV